MSYCAVFLQGFCTLFTIGTGLTGVLTIGKLIEGGRPEEEQDERDRKDRVRGFKGSRVRGEGQEKRPKATETTETRG